MTLMTVRGSNGTSGRCDQNCYDAREMECKCVCLGFNHGRGLDQSIVRTRESASLWSKVYAKENDIKGAVTEVFGENQRQESLF